MACLLPSNHRMKYRATLILPLFLALSVACGRGEELERSDPNDWQVVSDAQSAGSAPDLGVAEARVRELDPASTSTAADPTGTFDIVGDPAAEFGLASPAPPADTRTPSYGAASGAGSLSPGAAGTTTSRERSASTTPASASSPSSSRPSSEAAGSSSRPSSSESSSRARSAPAAESRPDPSTTAEPRREPRAPRERPAAAEQPERPVQPLPTGEETLPQPDPPTTTQGREEPDPQ